MGIQAIKGFVNYGDDFGRACLNACKKIKPDLASLSRLTQLVDSLPIQPVYPPINKISADKLVDMVNKPSASESIKKLRELIANGDVIPKVSHLIK